MPVLKAQGSHPAVMEVYATDADSQLGLLAALKRRAAAGDRERFGFVSASLHRSHDGQRVVNYVQWRSREAAEAAAARPAGGTGTPKAGTRAR